MARKRRRSYSTGLSARATSAATGGVKSEPDLADKLLALFPAGSVPRAGVTDLQRTSRRLVRRAGVARPGARVDPTPEQARRGTYRTVKTKDPQSASSIEVPRNMAAPIDRFLARNLITRRQYDAASRYQVDYARSGYERSTISRYDGGGGSGDGTPNMSGLLAANNAQLDARERLRRARAAMPQSLVVHFDAVVLHEDDAETVGQRLGRTGSMAARFAIEYVRICATELADYWRLPD